MALTVNLRLLENEDLHLEGDMPVADLDLGKIDEVLHLNDTFHYDLEVQKLEDSVLVEGSVSLVMSCDCVRCLKKFPYTLNLDPFVVHFPLEGEDKVALVNDSVDLTPQLREDIFLGLPQHPLCEPECGGLAELSQSKIKDPASSESNESNSSVWAALDKLKLKD